LIGITFDIFVNITVAGMFSLVSFLATQALQTSCKEAAIPFSASHVLCAQPTVAFLSRPFKNLPAPRTKDDTLAIRRQPKKKEFWFPQVSNIALLQARMISPLCCCTCMMILLQTAEKNLKIAWFFVLLIGIQC